MSAAGALRQKGQRCCRRLHALQPVLLPLSPRQCPQPLCVRLRPSLCDRLCPSVCSRRPGGVPQLFVFIRTFLNRCMHPPAGLVVFLNSMGELTAYDSTGDMLWQVGLGSVLCWHTFTLRAAPARSCCCSGGSCVASTPANCLQAHGISVHCAQMHCVASSQLAIVAAPQPSSRCCPAPPLHPRRSTMPARPGGRLRMRTRRILCPRCARCRCARMLCLA